MNHDVFKFSNNLPSLLFRRAPVVEASGPVFEFKLNITDSDFIIIADPSLSDSTAVILRSTTVLAYRPDMSDRPFSANLNNAEVFSCQLGGNEEDSALSIIDPVTINFEIAGRNVPGMPSKVRNLTRPDNAQEVWDLPK
jgi:vacuolar protein sorting-associated protein 13D